jgi:hypothetical protein
MVAQLLEVDDLIGCLTTGENRVLLEDLSLFFLLQHKLRFLIRML